MKSLKLIIEIMYFMIIAVPIFILFYIVNETYWFFKRLKK